MRWRTGLAAFTGAGRRFEHKGTYHGAEVYDDYAHHPDELHALLTTAKETGLSSGWSWPSSPTPTPAPPSCSTGFVEELKMPGRGHPGGDLRRPGAEHLGHLLGGPVPEYPRRCVLLHPGQGSGGSCGRLARPGDLILTVGAGDIYRAGEKLLAGV